MGVRGVRWSALRWCVLLCVLTERHAQGSVECGRCGCVCVVLFDVAADGGAAAASALGEGGDSVADHAHVG